MDQLFCGLSARMITVPRFRICSAVAAASAPCAFACDQLKPSGRSSGSVRTSGIARVFLVVWRVVKLTLNAPRFSPWTGSAMAITLSFGAQSTMSSMLL